MKKLLHAVLASSLLLSLSVPVSATEVEEIPIHQETLGQTYYSYFVAVDDYLTVMRSVDGKAFVHLDQEGDPFYENQAATLRAQAGNRTVYHQILNQLINNSMTETQKTKAIYNFPMYNFVRYDTSRESLPPAYLRTPYQNTAVSILDRGSWLLGAGTGGCQEYATLFHRLMNTAGIPCFNVNGDYVNGDGSSMWHAYNRAQVNGVWYWFDVDVDGSVYRRGDVSSPIYFLFQKESSYWYSNHRWDGDDVWAKEQQQADFAQTSSIFSYETLTEVSFNDTRYSPNYPLYGYVDIDSDFFHESIMLFPFFDIMEFLGIRAYWDGNIARLVVETGETRIEFQPNSYTCSVNGVIQNMAVPIKVVDTVDYISADELILLLGYDLNMKFYRNQAEELVTYAQFQGGNQG